MAHADGILQISIGNPIMPTGVPELLDGARGIWRRHELKAASSTAPSGRRRRYRRGR
jgi:hypothetical protein